MKKEIIKVDVGNWDPITTRIVVEALGYIDTDELRLGFAKTISAMSPREVDAFARGLLPRKFSVGLLEYLGVVLLFL